MKPAVILVNPWIYDFAAYDLWSKPLGLLYLAGYLRTQGFKTHLIDCLDVHHPEMLNIPSMSPPVRRLYGTGKYWRQKISSPDSLRHINRTYSRYGITRQLFIKELKKIKDPSAILMTSLMTYWYPGVIEAISLAREIHPDVPVILGGIYARLCEEHACRFSGADYIVTDMSMDEMEPLLKIMRQLDIPLPETPLEKVDLPLPAFDMLNKLEYVCILTSTGCPYRCRYCASGFLYPVFSRRDPLEIIKEIGYWNRYHGISDFAFYDDALLVDSDRHIVPILEGLSGQSMDLRFHTPNALHVREISLDIANLLCASGFRTIRLGLETSDIDRHNALDKKVSAGEFEKAVNNLKKAGYDKKEIGAYILMGLPGQSVDSVSRTIKFVDSVGAVPYLAEYSPLPNTPLWEEAIACSSYDISNEPLFHNNTLLPCWDERKRQRVPELKKMVREIRQVLY
ncbi:radical SAM protein [Deltaproteobacteria bacterium]|nr:radical SAM protein [Deltaproteobacteria bacterium]